MRRSSESMRCEWEFPLIESPPCGVCSIHPAPNNNLKREKAPVGLHIKQELTDRFISVRRAESVLGDHMRIAEILLDSAFLANSCRSGSLVHQLDGIRDRANPIRSQQLDLDLLPHAQRSSVQRRHPSLT